MISNYKISFCIVCMNRLYQLKQTLPKNLNDNIGYDNLEFVLLDYNSQDDMQDWVYRNYKNEISVGRMVYYRTPDPIKFCHSHSKNLAFKLATGDIVCNINADNYTGLGFATFVNDCFKKNDAIILTCDDFYKTKKNYTPPRDVAGKVCVKKQDFLKIGGFDERMKDYGFEDCDFVNRAEMSGLKRQLIEDPTFLNYLQHDNEVRFAFSDLIKKIHGIYVHYISPSLSAVLMLWNEGSYQFGTWVENLAAMADEPTSAFRTDNMQYQIGRIEDEWQTGTWIENDNEIVLEVYPQSNVKMKKEKSGLIDNETGKMYLLIKDDLVIRECVLFNFFYTNWSILENNLKKRVLKVNNDCFGRAFVYKNFSLNEMYV
jgi:hypothetical protein